ncbi:hypothetical protein DFH27DRAFT_368264 [Peziza echinospora]|nr:hypothetical protein DFH27DRAFT_368264 [Peziza echinospora]
MQMATWDRCRLRDELQRCRLCDAAVRIAVVVVNEACGAQRQNCRRLCDGPYSHLWQCFSLVGSYLHTVFVGVAVGASLLFQCNWEWRQWPPCESIGLKLKMISAILLFELSSREKRYIVQKRMCGSKGIFRPAKGSTALFYSLMWCGAC